MDWWAIILLVIPVGTLIVSRILVEVWTIDIDESFNDKNFLEKIGVLVNKVVMGIATVLVLPIGFVFLIVSLVAGCMNLPGKRSFRKLLSKGFKYEFKDKYYILTKNEIVIRVFCNFEDYYISFDNGDTFVRVEESNLGSSADRQVLNAQLNAYREAHPVDKQRGDAVPPVSEFVDFLYNNLISKS
jgi:hypothetical protein